MSNTIQPIGDTVLAQDMYFGDVQLKSGLIILNDNGKDRGIHARWCKVYAVGPKCHLDIEAGDWILVKHGRWSNGIDLGDLFPSDYGHKEVVIRKIDSNDILLKSKDDPHPENLYYEGKEL